MRKFQAARRRKKSATESNLAAVLISIVIVHIVCHALRVFLSGMAVHLIRYEYIKASKLRKGGSEGHFRSFIIQSF